MPCNRRAILYDTDSTIIQVRVSQKLVVYPPLPNKPPVEGCDCDVGGSRRLLILSSFPPAFLPSFLPSFWPFLLPFRSPPSWIILPPTHTRPCASLAAANLVSHPCHQSVRHLVPSFVLVTSSSSLPFALFFFFALVLSFLNPSTTHSRVGPSSDRPRGVYDGSSTPPSSAVCCYSSHSLTLCSP